MFTSRIWVGQGRYTKRDRSDTACAIDVGLDLKQVQAVQTPGSLNILLTSSAFAAVVKQL